MLILSDSMISSMILDSDAHLSIVPEKAVEPHGEQY